MNEGMRTKYQRVHISFILQTWNNRDLNKRLPQNRGTKDKLYRE